MRFVQPSPQKSFIFCTVLYRSIVYLCINLPKLIYNPLRRLWQEIMLRCVTLPGRVSARCTSLKTFSVCRQGRWKEVEVYETCWSLKFKCTLVPKLKWRLLREFCFFLPIYFLADFGPQQLTTRASDRGCYSKVTWPFTSCVEAFSAKAFSFFDEHAKVNPKKKKKV